MLAIPLYGPWYSLRALRGSLQAKEEFLYPLVGVFLVRLSCRLPPLVVHLFDLLSIWFGVSVVL